MIPVISIEPLYIVNMLVGMTLACCVGLIAWGRDRDLGVWAAGFALYAVAFLLFGLRGQISDAVSIILGNGSLVLMFALFTEGFCRLYHCRIPRLLIWVPPPLALLGYTLFLENQEVRVAMGAVLTSYHSLLVVYIVIRSLFTSQGRGKWIVFAAITFSSGMFLVRAGLMSAGFSTGTSFLTPGTAQTIYFSIGMVCLVMFAIGLLVTYKERAEQALLQLAHLDPLTQLGNRLVLQERLEGAQKKSAMDKQHGALMVLDLDYFKEMNDTYGHVLGDQLLIEVAARLKDSVRDGDTVVRMGGDEFVLLIENIGRDIASARATAQAAVERVLGKLTAPYHLGWPGDAAEDDEQSSYQLTVSLGVTLFIGNEMSQQTLFRNADIAMYQAKQAGRNCARFYAAG
ncbi:MAG: GGDEF domain-containing protein [Pseudomonadota bacterium]